MPIETLSLFAENPAAILSLGGFALGLVFGAIVLTTNFCIMGAGGEREISRKPHMTGASLSCHPVSDLLILRGTLRAGAIKLEPAAGG